jgi:hypothetical protein
LLRGEKQHRDHQLHRALEPEFVRIGVAKINNKNMRSRFIAADAMEQLSPRFDVIFEHRLVESAHSTEGYLRRYEVVAGVGNWNMEFTIFRNWFINSWLTQRDQLEGKPPTRSISLQRCLEVGEVSDAACYPNAFQVVYAVDKGPNEKLVELSVKYSTFFRLLLAAPTKQEQEEWITVLKQFVEGLKYWN